MSDPARLSNSSLTSSLNYGPESGPTSLKNQLIEHFLTGVPSSTPNPPSTPPSPSNLFLTSGISHSLSLLTSLLKPTKVYLESPTYFLASKIFTDSSATLHPLPMSSQSGYTYSNPSRLTLINWCITHKVYCIVDEVYHNLRSDLSIKRFREISDSSYVISLNSFTKIFSPGLRCGWVEGSDNVIKGLENLGYIRSQGGVNPFVCEVLGEAVRGGEVGRNVEFLREEYGRRGEKVLELLRKCEKVRVRNGWGGGYFIWVEVLGAKEDFVEELENKWKLVVMDGKDCGQYGEGVFVRVCVACLEEEELVEGVERFVKAVEEM
ncbi:hypothetical protein TrST_g352 [Triparma strigata]|uniref:Aminotransferase class I/classII large domain-containing protein n=1 Tax=Triparma strigata TaxID=1606541 RepID=A0A9W7APB5_9STRA|nr:hypothetical protein TrST_g352 [Triparma strigata]